MIFVGVAFLTGAIVAQQQAVLPPCWALLVGVAGALCTLFFYRSRWLAALLLGFCWTCIYAHAQLRAALPQDVVGQTIVVSGRVADLPQSYAQRQRFLLDIDQIEYAGRSYPIKLRVRLSWYRERQRVAAGERWRLPVRLKRPHGFRNPGGFDYERWLFAHGIAATGYVYVKRDQREEQAVRLDAGVGRYWIAGLRQRVADRLHAVAGDLEHIGSLRALSLGDRSGIARADWRRLTASGTNHLFAISGLHIGLVALFGYALVAITWRWLPPKALLLCARWRLDRSRLGCLLALSLAMGYAALAGFALPTQRALIMLFVPAVAVFWRRRLGVLSGFAWALLGVLLWNPLAPLEAGFWLSLPPSGRL